MADVIGQMDPFLEGQREGALIRARNQKKTKSFNARLTHLRENGTSSAVSFAQNALKRASIQGAVAQTINEKINTQITGNQYLQSVRRKHELERIRGRKELLQKKAKVMSLHQPGDIFYYFALIVAIFFDFLDLTVILAFPGVSVIMTVFSATLIGLFVFLAGLDGKRKKAAQSFSRMGLMMWVAMIEAIGFGLNLFPFETFMCLWIYALVITERKKRIKVQKRRRREQKDKNLLAERRRAQEARRAAAQIRKASA